MFEALDIVDIATLTIAIWLGFIGRGFALWATKKWTKRKDKVVSATPLHRQSGAGGSRIMEIGFDDRTAAVTERIVGQEPTPSRPSRLVLRVSDPNQSEAEYIINLQEGAAAISVGGGRDSLVSIPGTKAEVLLQPQHDGILVAATAGTSEVDFLDGEGPSIPRVLAWGASLRMGTSTVNLGAG